VSGPAVGAGIRWRFVHGYMPDVEHWKWCTVRMHPHLRKQCSGKQRPCTVFLPLHLTRISSRPPVGDAAWLGMFYGGSREAASYWCQTVTSPRSYWLRAAC
jgi:hypothetical protein